ncbi:MAG: tetratricopeptide repeat protein [Comamonadaceae bacterium]|nr:tetratricopeptide repeat protein [Burkholderiales bacterium]MEB2348914.1 tetratricopeptide repeat protein [Comamonadaceae bacterium]
MRAFPLRAVLLSLSLLLTVAESSALTVDLSQGVMGAGAMAAQRGPLDEAVELIQQGKAADAEKLARRVIQESPQSAAAHEVLGIALALQNKVPQAVEALQRSVKFNPRQYTAWTKLGDIAKAMGEEDKAISFYRKAVEIAPDDRFANQRVGLYLASHGAVKPAIAHLEKGVAGPAQSVPGLRLDLARLYLRDGRPERALELLKPWDDANSSGKAVPAQALVVLGDAWLASGEPAKAVARYRTVLARPEHAKDVPALLGLGRAQRAQQQWDDSIATLAQAGRLAPKDPAPVLELAVSEAASGAGEAAQQRLGQLVDAKRKPSADTLAAAARLYAGMGAYDKARDTYARAIAGQPKNPLLRADMAMVLLRQGDTKAALEQSRKRLELTPDDADAAFMVGMLEEGSGDKRAAAAYYERGLKASPAHWASLNNLALLRLGEGKKEEALSLARRASESAPENPTVLDTLARVHEASGNANSAARARLKLGELYLSENRAEDAKKVLQSAAREATDSALRAQIEARLKAL